ncbi:P-type conjugative transfer protein TrbG [Sphingomonadaceae bacterium G21617-S1]|uniref:P-type conjugative transfer protein TrbG n=1 Tax=Rhizorhabdus sp. TaxID=1968843 RepID=UPI0022CCB4B8|nr:P-type conjugative transfer protein TrbG [Sphingomonadaceae bacterium G21617-S1]
MKAPLILPALALVAAPCGADVVARQSSAPASAKAVALAIGPAAVPRSRPVWKPKRKWRSASPAQAVVVATRHATQEPARDGFINAVQVYPYSEGTLYRLFAAPEHVTDIALQPGESLGAVAAGDTVRWVIGDTPSGSGETKRTHVLVKPVRAGLTTNLVITTDRRVYHLTLMSTARSPMIALSWSYPGDQMMALSRNANGRPAMITPGVPVDGINFNYRIGGAKPAWRPLRVFDDGRQTFIEFPASLSVGEAPPLFLTDQRGEPQLVNYRQSGRYYVVDRLFSSAELRLGTKRQAVVRIERIAPAKGRA